MTPEEPVPLELAGLRNEYARATLDEASVDADPFRQFERWMGEAVRAKIIDATAMNVSTVDARGRPAGRICLLKGTDARGLVFFTNYESRKGGDLASHPMAALTFYWKELERQVRVEGAVEKVTPAESEAYYRTRPIGSRIGAWASAQSRPLENRAELEERWAKLTDQYGENPPCPPHWGGYRVLPDYFEFWQGRPSRLHDRVTYSRAERGGWKVVRLSP
jgi:pyridoxamine 5'-phosphate oxidase